MTATVRTVSAAEMHRRLEGGGRATIVDVRTKREFAAAHIAGARNLPLGSPELARFALEHGRDEGPVFVVCHSGARSHRSCATLAEAGLDVVSMAGGVEAWQRAGFPVERRAGARAVMPIERQVRIAAGSLVLTGCVLGWQAHPGFFGLAAFVGAGLVFAGLSGFCGMGVLLAQMPWNRR